VELIQILGYVGALCIGLVLGLIGGGGSILTVPILAYLFYINPVTATAYSLFVVGSTALVGTIKNIQKGMVDYKTGIVFAIPSFIAVYLTRKYLMPAIPDDLFTIGSVLVTKDIGIMVFFAIIMLLASISMIRNKKGDKNSSIQDALKFNYPLIIIDGFVVGILTGIVGAGGGFLIIPALVIMAKLPMKTAVATSLMIIAIKSLIGFTGDIQNLDIDWPFLLIFTSISIVGIFIGIWLNNFIEGKKLKKAFGYFVLVMAVFIIWRELN